ncbi:hypothetical protein FUAX_16890 [Fulvitalea axinellae]|uniref:Uncharacterized protein n=1 Tax=Fulvitalea axinellae TaxID=1182444 RepID=A0AAU9CQL3_9BACT|nr:hypothetical protein FUAX_16890 [Fulvitalea axinellae]
MLLLKTNPKHWELEVAMKINKTEEKSRYENVKF